MHYYIWNLQFFNNVTINKTKVLGHWAIVVVIVWYLDLQLHVQSVHITTKAVSLFLHSWRGVLDTALCDKVCQWLAAGRWFSLGTQVSSTTTTDCHDITEILLKLVLNIIIPPTPPLDIGDLTRFIWLSNL
jgi:hypothetical protein